MLTERVLKILHWTFSSDILNKNWYARERRITFDVIITSFNITPHNNKIVEFIAVDGGLRCPDLKWNGITIHAPK